MLCRLRRDLRQPKSGGLDLGLVDRNGYVLMFDIEAKTVEEAHIDICDPDQREPRNQVAAPTQVEHLKPGDDEEQNRDVVAETVLAGEEIEELSSNERTAVLTAVLAPIAGFAEDFFVGHGPRNARNWKREQEEVSDLAGKTHQHHRHMVVRAVRCKMRVEDETDGLEK